MKNFIFKAMLLSILALNPSYFASSSNISSKYDVEEIKRMSLIIHKNNLIRQVSGEYDRFYDNLHIKKDNFSMRKHQKNIKFINKILCYALESKSLPSIAIAQAILETGYGKFNKLEHNIFGIKGRGIKSKTKEFVNGRYITIKSEFQKFNALKEAFNRHYEIIGVYGYQSRNYKEWAYRIKECGYATDPSYAKKLIYIIEKHDLSRLDKIQELNKSLNSLLDIYNDRFSKV